MAYAAGLGHTDSAYYDTTQPGGVVAHPLFPIAPEWALLTSQNTLAGTGLTRAETASGVHAAHDLCLHRPVQQDMVITVGAEVAGVQRTRAGALVSIRFEGSSERGNPLWTTWMRSIYRGAAVDGPDRPPQDHAEPPAAPDRMDGRSSALRFEVSAPHVYSECSRIWNPIHTDPRAATRAGLPTTLMHGSATLAHGADWALAVLGARPSDVVRVGGTFRSPVPVPSIIERLYIGETEDGLGRRVGHFEVRTDQGATAVRDGFVVATR